MVLKNKVQKRIGLLFFIFSIIILIWNIFRGLYTLNGNIGCLYMIRDFSFFIYPFIFGISIFYKNNILKFLQVFCIGFEGILTIVQSSNDLFFGLLFLFISMLLSYIYGYFEKYRIVKASSISLLFVFLFSQFSLYNHNTPLISSILWVLCLWVCLLILWILFKDYVEDYKEKIGNREEYLQKSLEDLTKKIQEYSEISHISLDTSKELLTMIKNKSDDGGCG